MRRLLFEWRLGPFALAVFWPPFRRRKPALRVVPRPVLLDDEKTPVVPVKPITSKDEMP